MRKRQNMRSRVRDGRLLEGALIGGFTVVNVQTNGNALFLLLLLNVVQNFTAFLVYIPAVHFAIMTE